MAAYMEGPLSKWTNVMKGWQYRWFVLDNNAGLLSYYTSKEKMMRGSRRGCVRLQDAIIGIDDEDDSTFTITVDQKVFHFQARDADERKQWACALEDTILRHSQRLFENISSPSLDEFDKRLAEADAYLQLLIENVQGVSNKVNAMDGDVTEKQDLEGILVTAQEMVESVKKSIVLLQLAKTAVTSNASTQRSLVVSAPITVPVNTRMRSDSPASESESPSLKGTEAEQVDVKGEKREIKEKSDQPDAVSSEYGTPPLNGPDQTEQSLEKQDPNTEVAKPNLVEKTAAECLSAKVESSVDSQPNAVPMESVEVVVKPPSEMPPTLLSIPPTSYSSSEDEGEFYDADEDVRSTHSSHSKASGDEVKGKTDEENSAKDERIVEITEVNNKQPSPPPAPHAHKHEDLYMKEENHNETEGESVEEHKSVIMHLLSQVKLGMDLTKVVLPTFILERRSLLEMYADFFSHCDYFLEIAQKPTAEERMIACLRFYLSTFAAGRNSSVAKKPYNPILGETFQCFWNDPFPPTKNSPVPVEDGPVPWAESNQVSFLAEQVSHHPPVSAFYAEHKDKRIQFNGHIWTKSKFLGLSIGVHNIGQGCIRLLDHDEEYIINFPNGYGRSILTIPWVELGGDCTITCEKTGYNAFVKFHTKPFYGGKVHKVTAEVLQPNAKKPFCTMEGEWHTVMYSTYSTGKSECFVDAKKAKYPKIVRKIDRQEPMESRKLWEKVTYNLKTNNIDEATNGKRFLEDRQRKDAKERLEQGIVYKPKYFHEDDCQNWIFNSPLTDRT